MTDKHYIFASIVPLKLKFADALFADLSVSNPYIRALADNVIFPSFPEVEDAGLAFVVVPPDFMPKSLLDKDVIVVPEKYNFINDMDREVDKAIVDEVRRTNLPFHQEKAREFCLQIDAESISSTQTATDYNLYLVQASLITL